MKLRERIPLVILFSGIGWLTTTAAFAQTRGEAVTIRFTTFSPFIALLAGILILIMPRLLNYIVAIYLLLIGLIGIFGARWMKADVAAAQEADKLAQVSTQMM